MAVSRESGHRSSKVPVDVVTLLAGPGVAGDAHAEVTVQHRSRVAADPTQPNLRQVHLLQAEMFDQGSEVREGQGLRIGATAVVEVTGSRNPCAQIDAFRPGLLRQVVHRAADGSLVRRAGVMGVVAVGGDVAPGDVITVELPEGPQEPLERV
jgi:hypothetical protein